MATSFPGHVGDLLVHDGWLIICGGFYEIEGVPAINIARWNGTYFYPLASGLNADAFCMTNYLGKLAVGGEFTLAGGYPAQNVAIWDGSNWEAVGGGVNGYVYSMIEHDERLVVGGDFTEAGGYPVEKIAIWNGDGWDPFSVPGMSGGVDALQHVGSDLIAGGRFTTAGGEYMPYLARWDGNNWNSFGSGCGSHVRSILVDDPDIWVGGTLLSAGGKISWNIARWTNPVSSVPEEPVLSDLPLLPVFLEAFPNPFNPSTTFYYEVPVAAQVDLRVYDLTGKLVRTLVTGQWHTGGRHEAVWLGTDESGCPVASGVYLCKLAAREFQTSVRVTLVK